MKHRFCSQAFIRLTARNPISTEINPETRFIGKIVVLKAKSNPETRFLGKIVVLEAKSNPETRFLDAQVLLPSFQLASANVLVDPIPRRVVALLGCR